MEFMIFLLIFICLFSTKQKIFGKQNVYYMGLFIQVLIVKTSTVVNADQFMNCDETMRLETKNNDCTINDGNNITCLINQNIGLTMKPSGHTFCVQLSDAYNTTVANMTITTNDIVYTCDKRTMYFSPEFSIKYESVHRCGVAASSSCHEQWCEEVKSHSKLDDLSDDANSNPGFAGCMRGCRVCNYCYSYERSCLYYKFFFVKENNNIHEIYECPSWKLSANVQIKMFSENNSKLIKLELEPGHIKEIDQHMKILLTSTTEPKFTFFTKKFMSSPRGTAICNPYNEGHLGINNIGQGQCGTAEKAAQMNCSFAKESCNCFTQEYFVRCDCNKLDFSQFYNSETILPITYDGITIEKINETIKAHINQHTAMQLHLSLSNLQIVAFKRNLTCSAEASEFFGCYRCNSNAEIIINCTSSSYSTIASLICPHAVYNLKCADNTSSNTVKMALSTPNPVMNCTVKCSGNVQKLLLKGNLSQVENPILSNAISNGKIIEIEPEQISTTVWKSITSFFADFWVYTLLGAIGIILLVVLIIILYMKCAFNCCNPFKFIKFFVKQSPKTLKR